MSPLDADELFACLDRHAVRYVLIGGLAAVLHGSPLLTSDADICPARDPDNLIRLAAALEDLDARIRADDARDDVRFPRDATFLGGVDMLNLITRAGDLDLAFVPAGGAGYEDLARRALAVRIRNVTIQVASLEDVIRSKAAANRPKDLRSLPVLRQLLEELRRRGEG